MERFFCCLVEGTEGFSRRHPTEGDARIEAERLALQLQNHGRKVFILEAILFCQTLTPEVGIYELNKEAK